APYQGPQCDNLHGGAKQGDDQRSSDQRQPEIPGCRDDDNSDIGAEHEQFTMGEIDHIHDAENQSEPRRDEGEDHAGDDAVYRLDDDQIQWNRLEELDNGAHCSHPQVLLDHGVIGVNLRRGAVVTHHALFHDVDATARGQRQRHVLLDQQDGDAFVLEHAYDLFNL